MKHFSVFSSDPNLELALRFIEQHNLAHEVHLNRTRFWIPEGAILTEFYLRFDTFQVVTDSEDLVTGSRLDV
jgi:hypothetical protein